MAYVITEPCIGVKDAGCVAVCPVDCIHPVKESRNHESEEMLFIDPAICIDCGLCVDECPVQAIYPEHEVPEKWHHFIKLNAEYFRRDSQA